MDLKNIWVPKRPTHQDNPNIITVSRSNHFKTLYECILHLIIDVSFLFIHDHHEAFAWHILNVQQGPSVIASVKTTPFTVTFAPAPKHPTSLYPVFPHGERSFSHTASKVHPTTTKSHLFPSYVSFFLFPADSLCITLLSLSCCNLPLLYIHAVGIVLHQALTHI